MNVKIRKLMQQIKELEDELRMLIQEQEEQILYRVEGTRIEFEQRLKDTHKKLKVGVFVWLRSSKPRNVISAPFIYGMIVPMLVFDICLSLYQAVCFRLYNIPKVNRSEFMVFDRHHLEYLNVLEKLNCTYCAYGNGLIAYAREITARTEQYWCPIKHARKSKGLHSRHFYFVPYGDGDNLPARRRQFREALSRNEIPIVEITDTKKTTDERK